MILVVVDPLESGQLCQPDGDRVHVCRLENHERVQEQIPLEQEQDDRQRG